MLFRSDYIREKESLAALLYDDKIEEYVNKYVTTADPAGSISSILKNVKNYAENAAVSYKNYNDVDYLDQLADSHAVTYFRYTVTDKRTIPAGTLFIGTYLIDAQAINDVYYRYAKDSMGTFNQQIMYYKSELDSGHWKDILSAAGDDKRVELDDGTVVGRLTKKINRSLGALV